MQIRILIFEAHRKTRNELPGLQHSGRLSKPTRAHPSLCTRRLQRDVRMTWQCHGGTECVHLCSRNSMTSSRSLSPLKPWKKELKAQADTACCLLSQSLAGTNRQRILWKSNEPKNQAYTTGRPCLWAQGLAETKSKGRSRILGHLKNLFGQTKTKATQSKVRDLERQEEAWDGRSGYGASCCWWHAG